MQEPIDRSGQFQSGAPAVLHGITLNVTPSGYRADCLCGWKSAEVATRRDAASASREHEDPFSIDPVDGSLVVRRPSWLPVDRWKTIVEAVESLPPCPPWCRFHDTLTDHGYDSVDPTTGAVSRHHYATPPNVGDVSVTQWEERSPDGTVSVGGMEISHCGGEVMTPAEARTLAGKLFAAADLAEQVTR